MLLRESFEPYSPFTVTFRRPVRKEGLLYLDPEPRRPFEVLHLQIRSIWPDMLPYEGKFGEEYTPHLSVAYGEEGLADPDGVFGPLEASLDPHLPVTAQAQAVWLVVREGGHWLHLGTFRLLGDAPVFQQRGPGDDQP